MSSNKENRAKGNYISAAMQRGATNEEARKSWAKNGNVSNYDPFWGYVKPVEENAFKHESNVNIEGKSWHTSEDL